MTILVLLFLAVVWALVLVPTLLRRQAEARSSNSIVDFRRQLRVLQRTGPCAVAAAHQLAPERSWPAEARPGARSAQFFRRQRSLRRRRDTLMALLTGTLGSAGLGALPALHVLWGLAASLGLLLAAYVAALIHLRNLDAEREMRLGFLAGPSAREPALLLRRPAN